MSEEIVPQLDGEPKPEMVSKVVHLGQSPDMAYVVMEGTHKDIPQCEDDVFIERGKGIYALIDGPAAYGEGRESADLAIEVLRDSDGELLDKVVQAQNRLNREGKPVAFAGIQIGEEETDIISGGDSRVYYLDKDKTHMEQLTADHTPFAQAERYLLMTKDDDDDEVTEEDVYNALLTTSGISKKNAHRMNRGLGTKKGPQRYAPHRHTPGGVYMIVSDGAYKTEGPDTQNKNYLTYNIKARLLEDSMRSVVDGKKTPAEARDDLRTIFDGVEDDVSIILVQV